VLPRIKIISGFLLLLVSGQLLANSHFQVEPFIAREFGSTWFRMQVSEPIKDPPQDADFTEAIGQSELEYPLDVFLLGAKFRESFTLADERSASVFARIYFNMNDPDSKMQDSDWFGAGNGNLKSLYKYSYTQSSSRISWIGGELGFDIGNYKLLGKKVSYGAKIAVDVSSHEMRGIDGWQKMFTDSKRVEFSERQNELVLTYELFYFEPSVYVDFKLLQYQTMNWSVIFSLSPLTLAIDKDDHVLRNKGSETTAYGFGLGLVNEMEFQINPGVSVVADARMRYIRTHGKMSQKYYGDDPGTQDKDETGLAFDNIDNVISLFTQEIALGIRWRF